MTTAFDYFREALSEFMATCAFVFLMCGTGLSTRNPTNQFGVDLTAHFAVSLANGLAAAFVIYCFGNVSGAHFNPVVSTCLWAIGKLSKFRLVIYVAAQMAGGIFGAALLKARHCGAHACPDAHRTAGCVPRGRGPADVPLPQPGRPWTHGAHP
jgi:glycerol uptake facilitator-like aquaporin